MGDTMADIGPKRAELLERLERIVGNHCYNGSIQNWGPNGVRYEDGRRFRYPLTTVTEEGEKRKYAFNVSPQQLITGHYAFGANRLNIVAALDEVLRYLEQNHGLNLKD